MLKQDLPGFHGVHAPGVAVVPEARGAVPLLVDEVYTVAPAALRLRRAHRERRQGAYKEYILDEYPDGTFILLKKSNMISFSSLLRV